MKADEVSLNLIAQACEKARHSVNCFDLLCIALQASQWQQAVALAGIAQKAP